VPPSNENSPFFSPFSRIKCLLSMYYSTELFDRLYSYLYYCSYTTAVSIWNNIFGCLLYNEIEFVLSIIDEFLHRSGNFELFLHTKYCVKKVESCSCFFFNSKDYTRKKSILLPWLIHFVCLTLWIKFWSILLPKTI
jgi:hypothetical protein